MKRLIATLLVLAFFLTGCFGSFNLTREVYKFNKAQGNKWAQEIVFVILVVIPVYPFASLGDAVIFNSIEFWTGNNPVAAHDMKPLPIAGNDRGDNATLAYDAGRDEVVLALQQSGEKASLFFEKSESGIVARDDKGDIRFTATTNPDGSISVYDSGNRLVQTFDADRVAALSRHQG